MASTTSGSAIGELRCVQRYVNSIGRPNGRVGPARRDQETQRQHIPDLVEEEEEEKSIDAEQGRDDDTGDADIGKVVEERVVQDKQGRDAKAPTENRISRRQRRHQVPAAASRNLDTVALDFARLSLIQHKEDPFKSASPIAPGTPTPRERFPLPADRGLILPPVEGRERSSTPILFHTGERTQASRRRVTEPPATPRHSGRLSHWFGNESRPEASPRKRITLQEALGIQ
ncbi:Hypothetical predicted protein [Lecanosticta acicola]|uniref:Uncharacterized protein n=1 Tax=Lecanosticta acicola TaxID=111012 RepID=A0AAI9EE33_9PEZI|nr:Hypothetical predicted protein [Lecanosticta acicola]